MEESSFYNYYNNNNKKKDISYKINAFNIKIDELILNLKQITKTLSKQIISSNHIIKEILLENPYSKKIVLLYDRIEMLEDSRKLLENEIKSINYNLKYFFNDFQKILLFDNKINNINIKEINNNIEYNSSFNNNYIDYGYGNNKNHFDRNKFFTINYDFNKTNKHKPKNNSQSDIKFESKYEKYVKSQKILKKNNSSYKQYSMNNNQYEKNNILNNDLNIILNQNKKSRNPIKNQNYNFSSNSDSTFNTMNINNNSKKKININTNAPKSKITNKSNRNYSLCLAKYVIRFIFLIKEMKMKYNKKESIYDFEFKKIKTEYDKLKILLVNLSKKVIDIIKNKNQINNNIKHKKYLRKNNNINNIIKEKKLNIFNKLLISNKTNFSYIKYFKKTVDNIISKEITFFIINKKIHINLFIKNISQIHEYELKIINQNIPNLSNKENSNDEIIKELQEKIKILNEELSKYKNEINIENKTEESKLDKEQIELLLNENQELKNQIEEYKESNNMSLSNSKEEMEKYYKDTINENEAKIKFLTEQNQFYEDEIKKYKQNNTKESNDLVNLKIENSIIQKEFENIKKENQMLNNQIKEYKLKNNYEAILPDNYDIICDKNYEKLSWILLRDKTGNENDYESYLWIGKNIVNNLDKFNFLKEEDSIKIQIMNYISQLEEKDDIIYKLKLKLNKYEKVEI